MYFPHLAFTTTAQERIFFTPEIRDPKTRNISLDERGRLKGALGDAATQDALARMMARFRQQAHLLIDSLLPRYSGALRLAPTSYRPMEVEKRAQSWRADDRRLHGDAFPSRPNQGERNLRVFTNAIRSRCRVCGGREPFEDVVARYLPHSRPYSRWQAHALRALRVTNHCAASTII